MTATMRYVETDDAVVLVTDGTYTFHLPGKHNQKDHAPGGLGKVPLGKFAVGVDGPDMAYLGGFKVHDPLLNKGVNKKELHGALLFAGFEPMYVKGLSQQEAKATIQYFQGKGAFKSGDVPFDVKVKAFKGDFPAAVVTPDPKGGAGAVTIGAKGHNFPKKDAYSMRQEMSAGMAGLSPLERASVTYYQKDNYRDMNRHLRGQTHDKYGSAYTSYQKASWDKHSKEMQSAMKKVETQSDIVVFKGTRIPDKPQNLIGQTVSDKGMNSSSLRARTAKQFKPGEPPPAGILKIQVPKGTNAIYADAMQSNGDWEFELILPPGSSYLITGVDSYGNAEAEYIAPEGFK